MAENLILQEPKQRKNKQLFYDYIMKDGILKSTGAGLIGQKATIEKWLTKRGVTDFKLNDRLNGNPYFTIDINGSSVNLMGYPDESLPPYIEFNEIIGGNFICTDSALTTMRGFPRRVGHDLDISYSQISSLDYAPTQVDRDFVARGMNFSEEQIKEKVQVTCRVVI